MNYLESNSTNDANSPLILLPHIPKTAGSSFRESLKQQLEDRIHFDYVNPLSFSKYNQRPLRHKIQRTLRLYRFRYAYLRKQTDITIIYGHYPLRRYAFIRNGKKGMFFRNPIDLVCSYFFHMQRKWGKMYHIPQNLPDFIFRDEMASFYNIFMGPYRIDDLSFIGITEEYRKSIDLFYKLFRIKLDYVEVNKGPERSYTEVLQEMKIYDRVKHHLALQTEIYNKARIRFEKLCAEYNC